MEVMKEYQCPGDCVRKAKNLYSQRECHRTRAFFVRRRNH